MKKRKRRELEARIDDAVEIARSAERAALEIGDAAFDAADQARRAADTAVALAAGAHGLAALESVADRRAMPTEVDPLRHFTERADRVIARLRALDRLPAASSAS
ncbi:MAG TPA: hypothetical protein VMH33_07680 [Solirubrobacterales bacterium]|nr:hypothetical protein [Solirubrobacterales bacterium]